MKILVEVYFSVSKYEPDCSGSFSWRSNDYERMRKLVSRCLMAIMCAKVVMFFIAFEGGLVIRFYGIT